MRRLRDTARPQGTALRIAGNSCTPARPAAYIRVADATSSSDPDVIAERDR
jgi:hypothetical protein